MPRILKNFLKNSASTYVFQPASELKVEEEAPPAPEEEPAAEETLAEESALPRGSPAAYTPPEEEESESEKELQFARVQAEAILKDARKEAEALQEEARREVEAELDGLRASARDAGYQEGFAEGMDAAMREGKERCDRLAEEQIHAVETVLEAAAKARDELLERTREEMKDLALTIAEKVIRVSLRNSSDILLKMVDAATDKHKRCEWAHIYVADCDLKGSAYTAPELAAALSHVSERVRIIPLADDESGTCIVELPDVILDASVATQLSNIKEVLANAALDRDAK